MNVTIESMKLGLLFVVLGLLIGCAGEREEEPSDEADHAMVLRSEENAARVDIDDSDDDASESVRDDRLPMLMTGPLPDRKNDLVAPGQPVRVLSR